MNERPIRINFHNFNCQAWSVKEYNSCCCFYTITMAWIFIPDNSDELGCETEPNHDPLVPVDDDCKGPGVFSCDFGQCFPDSAMCDGHLDCLDGTDEPASCPTQHHGAKVLFFG